MSCPTLCCSDLLFESEHEVLTDFGVNANESVVTLVRMEKFCCLFTTIRE